MIAVQVTGALWTAIWIWPSMPLFIRRLHDQDRSGHWFWLQASFVLLAVAMWFFAPSGDGPSLSLDFGLFHEHRSIGWSPVAIAASISMVSIILATWILNLLPGTPGPNRYGPDPRLDTAPRLVPAET